MIESKMPILETARGAANVVFYNTASLIKVGVIPLALLVVVNIVSAVVASFMTDVGATMTGNMQGGAAMGTGMAGAGMGAGMGMVILGVINLIVSIALLFAMVAFSTAWIRFTLAVADGVIPQQLGLKWGRSEWLYLGYGVVYAFASVVAVFAVAMPFAFVTMFLSPVIAFFAGLGIVYLMLRLGFVFPAVTMDQECDPRQSWKLTADGHLHLFAIVVLCALPFVVVGLILNVLGWVMPVLVVGILIALIKAAITLIGWAVAVSALSLCYRGMTGFRVR